LLWFIPTLTEKITVIDIKAKEKKLFDIVNPDLEFGASPEAI